MVLLGLLRMRIRRNVHGNRMALLLAREQL